MADAFEPKKKRVQSSHAAEEIRVNELAEMARAEDWGVRPAPQLGEYHRRTASLPKGVLWGVAGLVVLFVAGFGISYYVIRHNVVVAISARTGALAAGVQDLQNFDLQSAGKEFSSASDTALASPTGLLGLFGSLFSGSPDAIRAFGDLSGQLSTLTNGLANVQNDIWSAVAGATITSGGESSGSAESTSTSPLIADLEGVRTALAAVNADTDRLSGFASALGGAGMGGGDDYLALKMRAQSAGEFLDALVPWLSDAATHHLLVLLENPSEMRPGGGFLGSYADVAIRGGAVTGIAVHDIADVDAGFAQKVIPPKPLQLENAGWRPADGNWFFDFPTSAAATISLFERSSLYSKSSVTFDGAIAVTPKAMSDLLSVTGPIIISNAAIGASPANGSTTFSADTLVGQIQAIVQAGQAKSSGNTYPKKVLGVLWPSILGKLASSTDDQRQRMLAMAGDWITNKDVMVYFKNTDLENSIKTYGAAGDEYVPPQNFDGDYLAVANADVNSDKSEWYVSSTVSLGISIGNDGVASDHLVVTRTHHGDGSVDWWYRTSSQDYMQVLVPVGSSLVNESGGFVKAIPEPVDYAKKGYAADPLVFALESATKQNFAYPAVSMRDGGDADRGKNVFAVWSRTYPGKTTQMSFDYTHRLFAVPADGVQYRFVFERQSGTTGHYKFEIDAPLGYTFAENSLPSYTYEEDAMPGRLAITLTLKKI